MACWWNLNGNFKLSSFSFLGFSERQEFCDFCFEFASFDVSIVEVDWYRKRYGLKMQFDWRVTEISELE